MKSIYQFILVWLSVLAYAQPSGACSEGTTRIDASGHLYGCVVDKWIKISEDFDVATATYSTTAASTGLAPANNNVMLRVGDKNYQLPNRGFVPLLPSAIADAPSHLLGKVFYSKANKHFYQGVDAGKWHQIDNEGFSSTKTGSYTGYFTRNNCSSTYGAYYTGSTVSVTRTASGTATSTISQADADSKAQAQANSNARALVNAEGQAEANRRGTCTYNPPVTTYYATRTETVSGSYTRNNCTSGTGSTVTVSRQGTATMTSTISQTDANNKASAEARARAQAALNREGQAEANTRGTCTPTYTTMNFTAYIFMNGAIESPVVPGSGSTIGTLKSPPISYPIPSNIYSYSGNTIEDKVITWLSETRNFCETIRHISSNEVCVRSSQYKKGLKGCTSAVCYDIEGLILK